MFVLGKDRIEAGIDVALSRLGDGLAQYRWIQENVRLCDVSSSQEFQTRFNAFYRVRRNSDWRSHFYALLENAKADGIPFAQALRLLQRLTNRLEASFASKLVATCDPSKPIIDSIVLSHFGLKLPHWNQKGREAKAIMVYNDLCERYANVLDSSIGLLITRRFDHHFPGTSLTALKKIDLVLWQIRA